MANITIAELNRPSHIKEVDNSEIKAVYGGTAPGMDPFDRFGGDTLIDALESTRSGIWLPSNPNSIPPTGGWDVFIPTFFFGGAVLGYTFGNF